MESHRHGVVLYRVMFACASVCVPNDSDDSFRQRGTDEKPMEAYFSIRQGHNHAFIAHGQWYYIESCSPVRLDLTEMHDRLAHRTEPLSYAQPRAFTM